VADIIVNDFERINYSGYPTRSRWTLIVAIVGLLGLTYWASVSEIDQVTRAAGEIIAAKRTQIVQAPDGGVLTELLVREGDRVKKGQLLAVLQKGRAIASVEEGLAKVAALKITLTRLRSEVYGTELAFSEDLFKHEDYIRNQTDLFKKRQQALNEDLGSLAKMKSLAQEVLDMNLELQEYGDVSRSVVLGLKREVAEIEAKIINNKNKYLQDALAEMTKIQEELDTEEEQLNERKQLLAHTDLSSPEDGVVKDILVTTLGGVLRPGDTVLEIFPTGGDLIAEVKVSPADIAFIALEQRARVNLDAYDSSIFGAMNGDVQYISADTIKEKTVKGDVAYYRVLVHIKESEFIGKSAESIVIRPGMTASVEIKARKRTVLSYLTKPIVKTLSKSLGER
jgi:adhesin transport system membrane fusion protein